MINTTSDLSNLKSKIISDCSNSEKRQNKQVQDLKKSFYILLLLIVIAVTSVSDGKPVMPSVDSNIQQIR